MKPPTMVINFPEASELLNTCITANVSSAKVKDKTADIPLETDIFI